MRDGVWKYGAKEQFEKKEKGFKVPNLYVILFTLLIVCTILTWILPAGQFDRVENAQGRMIVVPGTYHTVEKSPVGFFKFFTCIYDGMVNASDVIMFIIIAYAFIGLIIASGAMNGLVATLLRKLKGNARLAIIPIFMGLVGLAGSTIGCAEELYPFIPIFVGIAMAMGYDAITGMAIVGIGSGLGYACAFMNPFNVGTAQIIAELPIMSGSLYRIICHIVMTLVASIWVMRYAARVKADPTRSLVYGEENANAMDPDAVENYPFTWREKLVLLVLAAGIVVVVFGIKQYGWFFGELCAVFMIMGLLTSIIMGWSPDEICDKLVASFKDIIFGAMAIGLARGVLMVMTAGNVIDTVVYGMTYPLSYLPRWLAVECTLVVQTLLNFIVPSGSGQAVISMPIMAPMADLLGFPRQIAVLAFQFGDGLSNALWPTSSAAITCALAGVKMNKWWKFFFPLFLVLTLVQMIMLAIALFSGYGATWGI